MYNCIIMRFSCISVFRLCFCAGTCLGGLGGIVLGIMERSSVGILGGMFSGLLFGLCSGLFGVIYAAVFNLLSPVIGGLPVQIVPAPEHTTVGLPPTGSTASYSPEPYSIESPNGSSKRLIP